MKQITNKPENVHFYFRFQFDLFILKTFLLLFLRVRLFQFFI